jgi:hypothetical protein
MKDPFTPDPKLQEMARNFAPGAVEFAAKHFQTKLDYSDSSVAALETILDRLHRSLAAAAPPKEQIDHYAQLFGCYLGETFRRNHAATWGIIPSGASKVPSMRSEKTGTVFYPLTRAYKRITMGDEENVVAYYQYLLKELNEAPGSAAISAPPPQPQTPPPPEKKSFLDRLFGK